MRIDPKYLTLDDLLQKRIFQIPEYQRAYSWENKQRMDLFDDIDKLYRIIKRQPDRHHFMATIVCLEKRDALEIGTDQIITLDVVDGQQRLTTLIILLKEISKALEGSIDKKEQAEAEKINTLLVKGDQRLILLQTNHDNSHIFRTYLETGKIPKEAPKTSADFNLINAFRECREYVGKWGNGQDRLELLKLLKNRLSFIFYVSTDEGAVYSTFEVLNSRGMDVDWLDKCKTMLMGIAFERFGRDVSNAHIPELHKLWTKIYYAIGLKTVPGEEILRFTATLQQKTKPSRPLSSEESLEYFRLICSQDPNSVIQVSNLLLTVTEMLRRLYQNPRLSGVTYIAQARLLAVSVMLADKWSVKQQKDALEQWEKVTFRIYSLAGKDARTKVGEYTRLACEIYQNLNKQNQAAIAIKKIRRLGEGKEYEADTVIDNLRGSDCYNSWGNDLRYFLYRYEEYLAEQQGVSLDKDLWEKAWLSTASSTIEHIRPQKWDAKGWRGVLGRSRESVENKVNRLGNLVLLPPNVNSKARDKSFAEKKKIYADYTSLLQIREIIAKENWGTGSIKEREEKMLLWAKTNWS